MRRRTVAFEDGAQRDGVAQVAPLDAVEAGVIEEPLRAVDPPAAPSQVTPVQADRTPTRTRIEPLARRPRAWTHSCALASTPRRSPRCDPPGMRRPQAAPSPPARGAARRPRQTSPGTPRPTPGARTPPDPDRSRLTATVSPTVLDPGVDRTRGPESAVQRVMPTKRTRGAGAAHALLRATPATTPGTTPERSS